MYTFRLGYINMNVTRINVSGHRILNTVGHKIGTDKRLMLAVKCDKNTFHNTYLLFNNTAMMNTKVIQNRRRCGKVSEFEILDVNTIINKNDNRGAGKKNTL